jgi:hypothetical protein
MNLVDFILAMVGLFTVGWWSFGAILIAFFSKVYVHPGAPWWAKVATVVSGGFALPPLLVRNGRLPFIVIAPDDEEASEAVRDWLAANSGCDCPACRKRRNAK